MEVREFNNLLRTMSDDQSSLERLYRFFFPRIVRHVSLKFGSELANDVAQEFFVNLVRIAPRQSYIEYPTSWVYTCVDNLAKRKLSIENRYVQLPESEEVKSTQSEFGLKEEIAELLNALDDLSRQIITLFYWDGYNQNEIAMMLHMTPSAVRKRHSRALKTLKNLL